MFDDANEIFLGREEQLSDFLTFLQRFFEDDSVEGKPQVVLIHGQGGIGKSTLLREYKALVERNYPGEYYLLAIDWQLAREQNYQAFSGSAANIDPRVILQTINQRAGSSIDRWKPDANKYAAAVQKVHEALTTLASQSSKVSAPTATAPSPDSDLPNQTADLAGSLVSAASGSPEKVTELATKLVRYGISYITPRLVEAMMPYIEKEHGPDIELLLDSDNYLAHAMGEALQQISAKRRLIVAFDTYEIIDELDPLIRIMIKKGGPRVAWLIAGRHDLFDTRSNTRILRRDGYREEAGHRGSYLVTSVDLRALAREDIREYFRLAAPERPVLDDDEVLRVDRATSAIPLAIKLAAEIWQTSGNIENIITSEGLTEDRIVDQMVGRYEQHCVDRELDRHTLAALAMADGDSKILKAMLLPELEGDENRYDEHIAYVRHRYSAVQRLNIREPRLHDDPARFFRERLRFENTRDLPWVRSFNERAIQYLCNQINELINYHSDLKELCEDDDYVTACLKVANYLFWLEQNRGLAWLTARYVEGLAYSTPLREGLLEVLRDWKPYLSALAQKSLVVLEQTEEYEWRQHEQETRRTLLERDAKRGWLTDTLIDNRYEQEREKIRLWSAAESLSHFGSVKDAVAYLVQAAKGETSPALRQRIAATARDMSWRAAKSPEEVQRALKLAIEVEPGEVDNWVSMGNFLHSLKRYQEAAESFGQVTVLKPDSPQSWIDYGRSLTSSKQYEKAIECSKKAIELSPEDTEAWVLHGHAYVWLKLFEKGVEYYRKAIELRPEKPEAWSALGVAQTFLHQYDNAIQSHLKAIELKYPSEQTSLSNLAVNWGYLGRYDEAENYVRRSLELNPKHSKTLNTLGYLHMVRGERDEAIEAFESSISIDENFPNPHAHWARLLYRENKLEQSAEKLEHARTLDSRYLPTLLALIGINRLLEKSDDAALMETTKDLLKNDSDPLNHAQWLALIGSDDEAIAKLSDACLKAPTYSKSALFCPAFHHLRQDPRFIQLTGGGSPTDLNGPKS